MLIETHEHYIGLIDELKRNPDDKNVEDAIVAITELFSFYQTNKELPSRYRHLLIQTMEMTIKTVSLENQLQEEAWKNANG